MGMFDSIGNMFSGGSTGITDRSVQKSNNYYSPYYSGGMQDYNQMQQNTQNMGGYLNQYNNAGDYRYSQINQSPNDYYNNIMSGYSQSPDAQNAQQQAMRAANAGGAASGMLGSGAYYKGLQQNANDISQRDRQQYYQNVMGSNDSQRLDLQDLQSQKSNYEQNLQYLTQLGYNSGSQMSQNRMQQGAQDSSNNKQGMQDMESLASMAAMYWWLA